MLFFYTGVYSLNAIRAQDFLNAFFRDGFNCTVLAFVLNTCAYMTEIFAGAIRNTPHGEVEAARAYGMGGFTSTGASSCPRRCAGHCRTSATK